MKLELVGPLWDDEVVYTRLTIYDPDDHDEASALHTLLFLQSAFPSWADGLEWVASNNLAALDRPRSITRGDSVLTIQWVPGTRLEFILEVEAK